MEKIIAVVVMIAIVVALIAKAVMPTANTIQSQGDTALQDLTNMSMGMQDGQVMGSTVVQDYQINFTNITTTTTQADTKITFKVDTTTYDGTAGKDLGALKKAVNDSSAYTKVVEYYDNGNIKTMTYALIKQN